MKCDACGQEEVKSKKHKVGYTPDHFMIMHHECAAGHKWHVVMGGAQTEIVTCDCSN